MAADTDSNRSSWQQAHTVIRAHYSNLMLGAHENKHGLVVYESTPTQHPRAITTGKCRGIGERSETHLRTINPTIKRTRTTKNWRIIAAQYSHAYLRSQGYCTSLYCTVYGRNVNVPPTDVSPDVFFLGLCVPCIIIHLLDITSSHGRKVFWVICPSVLHPTVYGGKFIPLCLAKVSINIPPIFQGHFRFQIATKMQILTIFWDSCICGDI